MHPHVAAYSVKLIHVTFNLCSWHLDTDIRKFSSANCKCARSSPVRTHTEAENKRTEQSSMSYSCRHSVNSAKCKTSTRRHTTASTVCGCHKKSLWYHSQLMSKFIYLYTLLCVLCMVPSSVSIRNFIIEDQLTQVGHFFFYNISTQDTLIKDSFQLKVIIL